MQPVVVPALFQPDLKEVKMQLEIFEKEFLERQENKVLAQAAK